MRKLFDLDRKDYDETGSLFIRPSVRGIIIGNGKIAMVHSKKYDYYKFPGGGIEGGESQFETLIREVKEEAGLTVRPESIREFGMVHRKQKGQLGDTLVQDNYYYLCEVEEEVQKQILDDYEQEECFTLEFVEPETAIETNRERNHGPKDLTMIERESRVLEVLLEEGYFGCEGNSKIGK